MGSVGEAPHPPFRIGRGRCDFGGGSDTDACAAAAETQPVAIEGRAVNIAAYKARVAGKLLDYVLAERIGLLVDYDSYLTTDPYNYFNAVNDPQRYFRRVAPMGPVAPYEWVALRRISDRTR
jgi:hypothetical protein